MVEPALLLRCCAVRLHRHGVRGGVQGADSVFPRGGIGVGFRCDLNIALGWKRSAEPQDKAALRIWQPIG
jgi:hypothetical protein